MKEIFSSFSSEKVDYVAFNISLIVVITIASFILLSPGAAENFIGTLKNQVIDIFGSMYLILTMVCFIFLLYLAFTKYGDYKLGGHDSSVEFSTFSWIGMLFCSGIGGGIIYWSGVEWGYYVSAPPFGIEPFSEEAYSLSTAYGLFHWGISAWAIYGIPALALSISFYKYKLNTLRLSSSLRGLGINNIETTIIGRLVDLIFVVATIGAAGGTIGSYIPMLSSGFSDIFMISNSSYLDIFVLTLCVSLFGFSVYKGLNKGIKTLSNINLTLAILFLFIVLFIGPFKEIVISSFEGLRFMFINFIDMSTLGISETSQFANDWTIFYWAWWVAFGPLVALFIARVSKGRTIRELIYAMLLFGSLGTWLFYMILGGYSMDLDQKQILEVSSVTGSSHADMAINIVKTMPLDNLMLIIFCIITIIFVTTSYDSMSFVIAYHVQKNTSVTGDPSKHLRLFWAIVLGILPAALIIYSSHGVALDLIILASVPLIIIYPLMAISLMKELINEKT
tara:strand:- start:511 stop:2031 length:1521 start_codon:yes stop_codon:yes gene_type:complete